MKRFLTLSCIVGIALAARAQQQTLDDSTNHFWRFEKINTDNDWARHFRIGAVVGMNISASFSTKGQFNVSSYNPASGVYDDGYVRVDQTGNAGGYTGYWGYDNASQLNGTTLTMHSASLFTISGTANIDGGPFPGFEMAYGNDLWYWGRACVGWEAGFGLLPISITDDHPMSASVNQWVYTFDTGSIVVPTAPYQGGSSGTGPLIPDTPTSETSQTISGTITGTRTLKVMLYTLRFGPTFSWDWSEYFGMSLGAGPAIGVVSGNYEYDEIITAGGIPATNVGKFGATDMVFGGYLNAMLVYHAVDQGDFYAGVQYMPMSDAIFSSGGRTGQLNLHGQLFFSIGLNWPF